MKHISFIVLFKGACILEQPTSIKCYRCGGAAKHAFAYARFSNREEFLGVTYRGVCRDCLGEHIETIKNDRHLRGEWILLPAVFLPIGALLAALSGSAAGQISGFCLLGLALILPVGMRLSQRREARRASHVSVAENEKRYSEQMCREDALRTSRQTKLIYLRPEYADTSYNFTQIARETGVEQATAARIQKIAAVSCAALQTKS